VYGSSSGLTTAQLQGLAVGFPASSPLVTAVGGTQMAPGTFSATVRIAPGFDPVLNANIGLELVQVLVSNDLRGAITFRNVDAASETKAGALQPAAVRHVATPRPCLPPKMKPPLIILGTTSMHFALLNTSSGIPLSGVAIIACKTSTEESSRATESSRAELAQANVPIIPIALINNADNVFFMEKFPLGLYGTKRRKLQIC